MNNLLYIFATCAAIILVIVYVCYVEKKRKKDQLQKEKEILEVKINQIVSHVEEELKSRSSFLDNALLSDDHFFSYSECQKYELDTNDLYEELVFLNSHNALNRLGEDAILFYRKRKNLADIRNKHNDDFVNKELSEQKEFFDTVLNYPLDKQQRASIVKLEDNCLVISSAGSGKTSTMIGKLLYLVQQRKIQPSRILTITYTHKASDELSQRLIGTGLSCMTFHKLAMNIVGKVDGEMPSIADNGLFVKVFYDQLGNPEFRRAILNYLTDYKSMVKDEHAYESAIDYYKDRRKYGVIALYSDMDDRLITTKSEEEKKICSYLTELGVTFKYEEPYELDTYTEDYRQYRPDFSIYYKTPDGKNHRLYLEHFAIDASGQVPQWFGFGKPDGWNTANQQYLEGIEWKKKLHRENGTTLVYTTSADFHDKSIRTRLRTILSAAGVPIVEPTTDELLGKIMSRNKSLENALMQMTQSFINLVKANQKTVEDILQVAKTNHSLRDVFVIEHIMKPLWDNYQNELAVRKEMDFTDVIVKATSYCNEGKWNQKYEFILIDEFQDISIDRYRFLQSLRSDLPKTKLYCVGDDWQSIYRFTGSDMSLFSEYSKYFGYTEECKIETTYRFGNPLIDESSRFVQKNPLQKQKNVRPRTINPPETKISFMPYKSNDDLQSLLERMVARVPADKTVYIISRYSYDVRALVCPRIRMTYDQNNDMVTLVIAGRSVKFMTIHGSKGLEADYVFMLNCNSGLYGFPSLVSDDPVLDYVLSDQEHYEYAEERRVFYVGITRAKVHTVVMYNESMPSPFVAEMDTKVQINIIHVLGVVSVIEFLNTRVGLNRKHLTECGAVIIKRLIVNTLNANSIKGIV